MDPYLSLDVTHSGVLKSDTGGEGGRERGREGDPRHWQRSILTTVTGWSDGTPDLGLGR